MTANRNPVAWLRPFAGLLALVGALALSACGGGSGAPNNQFAPPAPVVAPLVILPAAPTIYTQVAATLTISGGVAPYRAFSSNAGVLPVVQNLLGNTVQLLAGNVSTSTTITITIQDSAGSSASVDVLVLPGPATPPPALTVLPSPVDIYSGIGTTLTISGGVAPYRAFSNNSTILPVSQVVTGNAVLLLAGTVANDTLVTVTIQDSVQQSTPVTVTVHPKQVASQPLAVLPASVVTSKGAPVTLTISGGVAPYKAYSGNPSVIPVTQSITGTSLVITANSVAADTNVPITIQDSAGQTFIVPVTVKVDSTTPLAVLPSAAVAFSGVPTTLTIAGGVAPYFAFSSNSAVLPVTQKVAGSAVPLFASNVAVDTTVTVTIQDSDNKTVSAAVTVRPAALLNALTITPNLPDCGTNAICSGQSGTAAVTLQLPGGGPAPGRQVRFDVVSGPFGIVSTNAAPTTPTVPSLAVFSDATGKAQVIIKANVDAPTQPGLLRVTDLTSGQQLTGSFIIQQVTNGATTLTVVPAEVNITGPYIGVCSEGARVDYFIYGGTPPYRVTQTFPNGVILLNSTVAQSGGYFEIITNGSCVNPEQFSIVDATGRQITSSLTNVEGTVAQPTAPAPFNLTVVPGDISGLTCAGALFNFVITGGTSPYFISASPRVGTSPTITPSVVQTIASSPGNVQISNVTQSIILTFTDSSYTRGFASQSLQRTITCPGSSTPTPLAINVTGSPNQSYATYVGSTCVGKSTSFTVNGGTAPYTVAFANGTPSGASIAPTTVSSSGGTFVVSGLQNSTSGNTVQNFITVTDSGGSSPAITHVDCPPTGP
jgi:hypothetical protein